ncbi:methylmalonyl-CoA epimerase [Symbiobacterium thermophilum]|uniref:Methylmalonyl-CoA epimerase n=3 Tax=Symbiobacterium thermophilum TaxID=2734 RepID=A0A953LJ35_SYMTR|nr:methylmalonyl-CoA epimerase [Symbiobacterium thermophilum]MBY6275362.1 methylmalonyl-CoA epimerase [Symbiobacterium thermophilum]BAD40173.1 putative lactoylglutathione lyase [Symbiobacterium thermophilum IAM 14863]
MMMEIDHIGIAVRDLQAQIALYRDRLGLRFEGVEEVPAQKVRVAFFAAGGARVELLESTAPDGPIARHIERRGEGLHHVAYRVADIRAAMAEARAQGMELVDQEPRPGAHGALVCFLHPRSTGGVLTELVQHVGSEWQREHGGPGGGASRP